ncbi:uncharacterized protein LOC121779308 [Salvia splendens]|uniref:uncharacterized protein LOC121779308 n=1 Tax=Salvia splendens TaxID=180675 RepID=UPI001C258FDF|nr:uncharacterized protein LOC121779308 [Salvia splendens]
MGRKRERRAGDRTDKPSGSLTESDRKGNTTTTTTTVLLLFVVPIVSVIVYRILHTPSPAAPDLPYVYRRGLVAEKIDYRQVLHENTITSENSSRRNFENPVFAYITPWNSQGYEMAKKFSNKFTHLSPVWYELKSQETKLVLEGRHNADKRWISDIKRTGNSQILPRVVLEAIPLDLLKKKKQRERAINLIVTECKEMGYDGIVLESWSRWAAYGILHEPGMRVTALQFVIQLGQAMHSVSLDQHKRQSLQLVYVIGPPRSKELEEYDFGPEDLRRLGDDVDGFSLMTYDFSAPQNPGPNAPLKWIHSTLELLLDATSSSGHEKLAKKIFIGINFYGNDFIVSGGLGGGPIVGREYVSLLEQHRPQLQWEKNSEEHFFLYIDNQDVKHVVFYPTLKSIATRLQEAASWGAGISIWEIGQGLEYFFDILEVVPFSQLVATLHLKFIKKRTKKPFHLKTAYQPENSYITSSTSHSFYVLKNLKKTVAMEALNAAGLSPLSVLAKTTKPRKHLSAATIPQFKIQNPTENVLSSVSRKLQCGLMVLSSVMSSEFAKALTYEEALQQTTSAGSDTGGFLDNVISFATDNPLIIGGGLVGLAVPLVVSQLFSKPKPWGVETAKNAYAKLGGDDSNAQLLDIRAPLDLKEGGSPDIRGLKKKLVAVAYKGEDKPGFLSKLSLKFKDPENTTLFILDKFDGNSELVAELVTVNGFKAAYAIKDGAEGPRGWKSSGLPWISPKKSVGIDLSSLTDSFGDASEALPLVLGVAAAAGLGLLAYTEVETILQVLGSAALVQFVSKKLLFAKDRKQTVQQIGEVLNAKVGAKELVGDIQDIGKALLPPIISTSKSLPAAAEVTTPPPSPSIVQEAESVPEANSTPLKVEAAPEPTPEVNSVPKAEVEEESLPLPPRPLSPYPNYPDYKPPTSPIPLRP